MADRDEAARAVILARLATSREELRNILDPPRKEPNGDGGATAGGDLGAFPRSRTMQMLLSGRGLGTLGAAAAGLLVARPALALRLLRLLPASAIGKMILTRALTAVRSKHA
jgi:hypothetical protein